MTSMTIMTIIAIFIMLTTRPTMTATAAQREGQGASLLL
jgi:hypothetical protein